MAAQGLLEIEAARDVVLARVRAVESEQLQIDDALGRVLHEEVRADAAVPPFANSAMDGYAVRARDVAGASPQSPVTLALVGESRAGAPASVGLRRGQAIAISTGAQLPAGADAVVPLENASAGPEQVEVLASAARGRHVREAGEDIRDGQLVLEPGRRLGPAELGVLASLGREEVLCARRPRLATLVTGDELLAPGERGRAGAVRDSNSSTIPALARSLGVQVISVARVADSRAATTRAIAETAPGADLLVISGGVSVGAHDHVRASLAELGAQEEFWGLALKPGRPAWFGMLEETLVFGLPGNPVSAMVTFALLVAPALGAMQGARDASSRARARLGADYAKPRGRAHALRCRVEMRDEGPRAIPAGAQGSHILTSMLDANALAIIPAEREQVRAGEWVEIEMLPGRAAFDGTGTPW